MFAKKKKKKKEGEGVATTADRNRERKRRGRPCLSGEEYGSFSLMKDIYIAKRTIFVKLVISLKF